MVISLFQELQHEVSSLLEFKNALLETFPHLQSRMSASSTALSAHLSGSTGELANARKLSALDANIGGSTGQLNQFGGGGGSRLVHHPQPYLTRHVDVVSSDDTQPSWNGIQHTQVRQQEISQIKPVLSNIGFREGLFRSWSLYHRTIISPYLWISSLVS